MAVMLEPSADNPGMARLTLIGAKAVHIPASEGEPLVVDILLEDYYFMVKAGGQ
ncbi:hypothetical protein [Methanocella sp. MCL-LM]|uniref:hypothetical protein n=1 Tax=Methanocella sp. MCL-LM TaxID=3412035 RepID=UPI003C74D1B6